MINFGTSTILTIAEQTCYDQYDDSLTDDKILWLQAEIKAMVDAGKLTKDEKAELISSIENNLAAVQEELSANTNANAGKKSLEQKIANISSRKEKVAKIEPVIYRLKHGDEIQKYRFVLCNR